MEKKESIEQLVVQYRNENDNLKKDDIFQKIYSNYKYKFNRIAYKLRNEDLSQELCIALLKAINTYKEHGSKAKFNTYFWKVAQNHIGIINYYNRAIKRVPLLPLLYLDQPIIMDNSFDAITLGDIIEDDAVTQQFHELDLYMFLEQEIFPNLPDRHIQIIKLYLLGYTMREICRILNITQSSVQNCLKYIQANKNICQKFADYLDRKEISYKKRASKIVYSIEWVEQTIKQKLNAG